MPAVRGAGRQRLPHPGRADRSRYHTARFALVASLRDALTVLVPPDRHPGRAWAAGPELPAAAAPIATAPIRIGYARTSTVTQELASQLDVLARAGCTRVFSE